MATVNSAKKNVDAMHPAVTPEAVDTAGQVAVVVEGTGEVLQTWGPFLDKLRVFVEISKIFEDVSTAEFSNIYDCSIVGPVAPLCKDSSEHLFCHSEGEPRLGKRDVVIDRHPSRLSSNRSR
jgi:hypothetical protein